MFSSGSIGIAALFFTASGLLTLCAVRNNSRKVLYQEDFPWLIFLIFAIIINGVYFIRTLNRSFPLHTLYWIYSAFLIWTFRTLYSESFMSGLCWMCRINLIFQVLLLVSGRGRYFYETWGGSRFRGTFNDPNQFAFFIFIMMLVLFMEYRRKAVYTAKTRIGFWGMFLLGVFLIGKAKSTGMFIGLLVFVGVLTGQFFWDKCCHSKQKKVWWFGGAAFLVLLTVDVYLILPGADFDVSQTDYTLLSRIQQKIWKLANGNRQLGLPHEEFIFSKNMLNPNSPHFGFFTFPNAFGMMTPENEVVFNCESNSIVSDEGTHKGENLPKAKAYLQKLYDDLAKR